MEKINLWTALPLTFALQKFEMGTKIAVAESPKNRMTIRSVTIFHSGEILLSIDYSIRQCRFQHDESRRQPIVPVAESAAGLKDRSGEATKSHRAVYDTATIKAA
jgi:hypothetical protein